MKKFIQNILITILGLRHVTHASRFQYHMEGMAEARYLGLTYQEYIRIKFSPNAEQALENLRWQAWYNEQCAY